MMSKKEQKEAPVLRFKGFTNAWERRRFGDYYKIKSGYAFKRQYYTDSGITIVNGESIQNVKVDSNNFNYFPDIFLEKYSEFRLRTGDIVLGLNRPITNGKLKIAKIPSNLNNSLLYQRAGKIEYTSEIDNDFSFVLLEREILKHTQKEAVGSDQPFISTTKLSKWQFTLPTSVNERKCMGKFFSTLDNIITLQERKCEALSQMKQGFLQKMFPKKEEKVPDIRFGGFNDAWKQQKLSEYLTTSKQKNKEEKFTKEDVLSVSGEFGIVNQIEFQGRSFADVSVAPYGVVEVGDVVYTKSPLKANPYGIIKTNKGKTGIVSTLYAIYKPNKDTDGIFVQYYFENDSRMNSYMKPLVNKGAKNDMKVSSDNALKGKVKFPVNEEQVRIRVFFEQLDNTITLYCPHKIRHEIVKQSVSLL